MSVRTYECLQSKTPLIILINCHVKSDRLVAKLVYSDRFIFDNIVHLKSDDGDVVNIIMPEELKGLEREFTGVHEGLFDFVVLEE